ncbi:MAG: glycosyltransferase [Pseudomonadota bacterium]|nr:glycosyltransferase [Pseudomonadota bacterium]
MNSPKTLLQIRYRDDTMRVTCNQYLDAFASDFYRVVVFLTGSAADNANNTIQADEIVSLELSPRQLKGLRLGARRRILELVNRYDPSLILAHRWKATSIAVSALSLGSKKEIPIFSVVHALHQLESLSRRLVGRFILKGRCRFIGVSEAVRQDVLAAGFGFMPEDVLALSNTVDVVRTESSLLERPAARRILGLDPAVPVCGHVGRMVGAKDQKTLISAFAKLRQWLPTVHLVMIGEGRLEEALRSQVKSLGLEGAVTFAGAQDQAVRLMPAFDLFVLTSVTEGFPRVLLEAMVCRLPIVATDSGGIREALGNDVKLCRAGDVEGVSCALERCLKLDEVGRRELGEKGYRRVVESFSRKTFRQRLFAFIEQGNRVEALR